MLVPALVPIAAAGTARDLTTDVNTATSQLRLAWAADPTTAALRFPVVRLLQPGESVDGRCNPKAPARRPAATAASCATSGELLLDRDLLEEATAALKQPQARTLVAYWIATALAERLLQKAAAGAPPQALDTLQANCLAGVLLGGGPARQVALDATPLLLAARGAYGDRYRTAVGSASQRGYALLTGLGATATPSCSAADMQALLRGSVPDPALLARIDQLPPQDRAFSSLQAVISSQCKPLPRRPCPRQIASSQVVR